MNASQRSIFSLLAAVLIAQFDAAAAAPAERPSPEKMRELASQLTLKHGKVVVGSNLATFDVPADFGWLDPAQTRTVLEKLWGNRPSQAEYFGMIVPAGFDPLADESWAVTVRFEDDGYVSDEDAAKIDFTALLKDMKEGTAENNKLREQEGYPRIDLIGWATPPRYDATAKKLYWAKELQVGDSTERTLNYAIRVLGRRGFLELNAIAGMTQLKTVEAAAPRILAFTDFNPGNRYADFNSSTDKMAAYGLAGLVAGGIIAKKVGLLKGLWVLLLASKKLLIVAGAAIVGLFAKLKNLALGKKREDEVASANPPSAPSV